MIDNSRALQEAITERLGTTRRAFFAFVPNFDPRIWHCAEIVNGLRTLLIGSPQASVRLCLRDIDGARERAALLLALCERLPSRCGIRLAADEHRDIPESFFLFDRHQYLRRATPLERIWLSPERPPNDADRLQKLFVEIWENGILHPELRRLTL